MNVREILKLYSLYGSQCCRIEWCKIHQMKNQTKLITQRQLSLNAQAYAQQEGFCLEVQYAALLHNIGHMNEDNEHVMISCCSKSAEMLEQMGFSDTVSMMVEFLDRVDDCRNIELKEEQNSEMHLLYNKIVQLLECIHNATSIKSKKCTIVGAFVVMNEQLAQAICNCLKDGPKNKRQIRSLLKECGVDVAGLKSINKILYRSHLFEQIELNTIPPTWRLTTKKEKEEEKIVKKESKEDNNECRWEMKKKADKYIVFINKANFGQYIKASDPNQIVFGAENCPKGKGGALLMMAVEMTRLISEMECHAGTTFIVYADERSIEHLRFVANHLSDYFNTPYFVKKGE